MDSIVTSKEESNVAPAHCFFIYISVFRRTKKLAEDRGFSISENVK